MFMDYVEIIEKAKELRLDFEEVIEGVPYELHGVLNSEVLFMLSCMKPDGVGRLVESGRARGQSTFLFARALKDKTIVSIDLPRRDRDSFVAEERLDDCTNVELLYGDSREYLPKKLGDGDVVFIDGPKGVLAFRLALKCLSTGRAPSVFIHDVYLGTVVRYLLERYVPEARFSDHRGYAEYAHVFDENAVDKIRPGRGWGEFAGEYGYGYSIAYIPYNPNRAYKIISALSFLYDFIFRVRRKFKSFK